LPNPFTRGKIGDLRKIAVHDGHQGRKEIGVGPEFLTWLTEPKQNGGSALFDFGCYGADLATWIMHGELPLTVIGSRNTTSPHSTQTSP
jgi:glucose-fructose oxidoreductase